MENLRKGIGRYESNDDLCYNKTYFVLRSWFKPVRNLTLTSDSPTPSPASTSTNHLHLQKSVFIGEPRPPSLAADFGDEIMLSLSLNEVARRMTWTCLSCTSQAVAASWSRPLRARTHHRRHSSSKPSSPPKDVPRTIDAPAEAPGKESKTTTPDAGEKRASTRLSRRKSKDGSQENVRRFSDEAPLSIPSVPSTQHLHPQGKTRSGLL